MKAARLILLCLGTLIFPLAIHAQSAIPRLKDMLDAASVRDESKVYEIKSQIDMLDKPEKGDRKVARSQNDLGLKLLIEKDFDGAVKIFEKASTADRSDVEIRNNLGYALMKAGKYDAARAVYFDALALAPGRSGAWFNLGETIGRMGDKTSSVAAFDIAYSFSQNKERTHEFLEKLINDPTSSPTVAAAAKQAAIHKGIGGVAGQSDQSTSGATGKDNSHDTRSTSSQTLLEEKAPAREYKNQCALIQSSSDKVWCFRTEINQRNKELDELKLRYKIIDQVVPSCTGLKEGAYEECRLKNIQEAIDQINLNAAKKVEGVAGNRQIETSVPPIATSNSIVVNSDTENSSTVPASVAPPAASTGDGVVDKVNTALSRLGETDKHSESKYHLLPEPILRLHQFGNRLLLVAFFISPIIGIYLHRKGVLVLYANYTDAVFTCTFPVLLIVALLFSVLVSRTLGFIVNADDAVLNILDAAFFCSLVIYGIFIVVRETFFSNGLSWKFLLSLSAKLLLALLFYLSLVLIFARRRGKHSDETTVQYDRYRKQQQNDNLIAAALSTSAFGLLIAYVCRDNKFVSLSEYFSLFRRTNQFVANTAQFE